VEQDEQAAGAGDPRELAEPGFGVWQVADQAGREDSVGARVGEGQASSVGENEHGGRRPARAAGLAEHFRGHIDGDHGAGRPDRLTKRRQRPAGAAAHVDDHAARRDLGPGDGRGVAGHVIAELSVPSGGAAGEERAGLGKVPLATVGESVGGPPDHRPVRVVHVDHDVRPVFAV
jgi:hypothetical protein